MYNRIHSNICLSIIFSKQRPIRKINFQWQSILYKNDTSTGPLVIIQRNVRIVFLLLTKAFISAECSVSSHLSIEQLFEFMNSFKNVKQKRQLNTYSTVKALYQMRTGESSDLYFTNMLFQSFVR